MFVLLAGVGISMLTACATEVKQEGKSLYETVKNLDSSTIEAENEMFQYSYAKNYESTEKATAFTNVDVLANDPEWAVNHSHFEDLTNNKEMSFIWEAPEELGDSALYEGNHPLKLVLRDFNKKWTQELTGFYAGEKKAEDASALTKEEILGLADEKCPYIENGYYEATENSYSIAYTFAIANEEEQGYLRYLIRKDNGICYQFTYLEKKENYDDTRAVRIIESINFWNYYPAEES